MKGSTAGQLTFEVRVDPHADPITGAIRADDLEVPFVGWMGLATALEQVLAPARAAGADEPPLIAD